MTSPSRLLLLFDLGVGLGKSLTKRSGVSLGPFVGR
jgi:hypothetical protein